MWSITAIREGGLLLWSVLPNLARTRLFMIFCACLPCVVYTYVFSSDVGHKTKLSGMFCYERATYCSNELSSLNSFSLQHGFQWKFTDTIVQAGSQCRRDFCISLFQCQRRISSCWKGERGELETLDLVFSRHLLIIFFWAFCKSVFTHMGKNRLKKKIHKTTCVDLPKLYKSLY